MSRTRIIVATLNVEPGEPDHGVVVEMDGEEYAFTGWEFDEAFAKASRWLVDTPDLLRLLDEAQDQADAWLIARGAK